MIDRLKKGLAISLLLALGACASENMVVLVADPDGHVGRVEVANAGGTQLLTRANTGTRFTGSDRPPTPPEDVTAERIQKSWGDALAAMPDRPRSFILYFDTGTTSPNAEGMRLLSDITAETRRRNFPRLFVVGQADATGSDELNVRISRERAQAVADLLVAQGIDRRWIEVTSHGKRNPLIPTPDGVAEPRNRRVGITVQ